MPRPASGYCHEPGCRARLIFIPVHKQGGGITRMPLNADPDPAGNVIVSPSGHSVVGRIKRKNEQAALHEVIYMPHFATCTKPRNFRRRDKPAQPPQAAALTEETP